MIAILVFAEFYILGWLNKDTANYNLVGFYNLTKEDPLFYSSFFEEESFQKSLDRLKMEEIKLKNVAIDNILKNKEKNKIEDIFILETNRLFPYQFLETLISINIKTNEFYKNPSTSLGKDLLNLYDDAVDFYIKDVSARISVIEKTGKYRNPNQYFFFVDSVSSLDVIKNDLLTIKKNGNQLREEINKRKGCLLGKEKCEETLIIRNNNIYSDLLSRENFSFKGENADFIKKSIQSGSNNKKDVFGPYKISSPCWQSPNFEQWMYLSISIDDNGEISMFPKLATKNYYEKISENNTLSYEKYFEFLYRADATSYRCTNLTFYPELLVLNFIKEGKKNGTIGADELEKNLDYKILLENQFGLLSPALNAISNHILTLRELMKIDNTFITPEFLFSIRAPYSIFYFPFAKSIWRIEDELQYLIPKEKWPITDRSEYYTMDELEKLGYTIEKIKTFHPINFNEFVDLLINN